MRSRQLDSGRVAAHLEVGGHFHEQNGAGFSDGSRSALPEVVHFNLGLNVCPSSFKRRSVGEPGAFPAPLPVSDPDRHGSQFDARRACRCSGGRCCNARRSPQPDAAHLRATAAFPDGCTPLGAICASVRFSVRLRTIGPRSDVRHARDPNELHRSDASGLESASPKYRRCCPPHWIVGLKSPLVSIPAAINSSALAASASAV